MNKRNRNIIITLIVILCILICVNIFILFKASIKLDELENKLKIEQVN